MLKPKNAMFGCGQLRGLVGHDRLLVSVDKISGTLPPKPSFQILSRDPLRGMINVAQRDLRGAAKADWRATANA